MSEYTELDLHLTGEHEAFKAKIHAFARDVLRPIAGELDMVADPAEVMAPSSRLWEGMRAAYGMGLHTVLIPKDQGGLGLDGTSLHIMLEELGWGSADFAINLAVAGFPFAMASLASATNADLVDELVTPFTADKSAAQVGCWAITEPDHGSDEFMVGTEVFHDPKISGQAVARRDGDEWVLSGQKSAWVSNGTISTHAVVYLTLDPEHGLAGGGVAYVPMNLPGVTKGPPLDKLGQRALNQGEIIFKNVRIPARYMLFESAAYETVLNGTLALTNSVMGAIFTGVARAAYEEALAYTQTRIQGGKPLCRHQLVQKHLFDMFALVQASRELSRAALLHTRASAEPAIQCSIAAKVFCTQAALDVTNTALQLHGGKGLKKGFLVEKLFRDARASLIEDGANDILALVGAGKLIGG